MSYLSSAIPALHRLRLPFSRDQLVLLVAAVNEIILGLDVYLAHNISGTIVPYEWIPIIFGPLAGVLLLLVGLVALRFRPFATRLATVIFFSSVIVGVLGSYFHLIRASLPAAPFGQQLSVDLLVWAPPILGPISFAGVAILGLSAAWIEDPVDSGILVLGHSRRLHLPYSKTRGYLFLVSLGILAALISSVLDHARTGFSNAWLWLPVTAGAFGTIVAALLGTADSPSRRDIQTYVGAMLLMILVGLVGAYLHVQVVLTADNQFIFERFLRGAPFLAPMQFSNLGLLGLLVLLDPTERKS
ncbi:MAG: hypothetical protein OEZ02_03765 [Anaerolineae bacterium]|nr:hypothetical protein [Anaerolineae bacterium]